MLSFAGLGGAYLLYRACTETKKWIEKEIEEAKKKKEI